MIVLRRSMVPQTPRAVDRFVQRIEMTVTKTYFRKRKDHSLI